MKCPLVAGDVVLVATDGLYDNVYESQILDLLEATWGQDPSYQAQVLVSYARQCQEVRPCLAAPHPACSALRTAPAAASRALGDALDL